MRIYTIGDSNYDIIFKDGKPISGTPGGSMFNVAISLGRLGYTPHMIGDSSTDQIGAISREILKESGVDTSFIKLSDSYSSKIALAFLDENNNAEYSFYKSEKSISLIVPEIKSGDIVVFGSSYALRTDLRSDLLSILKAARRVGAITVYDPNYRTTNSEELTEHRDIIDENISYADIVKASDEDIKNIYNIDTPTEAFSTLKTLGCNTLVHTADKDNVTVINNLSITHFAVPIIEPINTIGAGDSFNAALISKIAENSKNIKDCTTEFWNQTIPYCIEIAQIVCMNEESYIPQKK